MPLTLTEQIEQLQQLSMDMLTSLHNQKILNKNISPKLDELIKKTQELIDGVNKLSTNVRANSDSATKLDRTVLMAMKNYMTDLNSLMLASMQLQLPQQTQPNVTPSAPPMTQQFDSQNTSTTTRQFMTPSAPPMTQQFDSQNTSTTTRQFMTPSAPPMTQKFDEQSVTKLVMPSAPEMTRVMEPTKAADFHQLQEELKHLIQDAVNLAQILSNNVKPGKGFPVAVGQLNILINMMHDYEKKMADGKNMNVAEIEHKIQDFNRMIDPHLKANAHLVTKTAATSSGNPNEWKDQLARLHDTAFKLIHNLREKTPQGSPYPHEVGKLNMLINQLQDFEKDFHKLITKDKAQVGKQIDEFERIFTDIADVSAKRLSEVSEESSEHKGTHLRK